MHDVKVNKKLSKYGTLKQVESISDDLRPISLTPTLSKIAEDYIVHVHVKPAVLEQIGKDQYGCIPHSSTSHALINMIHQWTKATNGTGASVRVFVLDYKKAFDLIDHNILLNKLSMYKINPFVVNWICDFLSNRHQRVKLAEDCFSEWQTPSRSTSRYKVRPMAIYHYDK